MKHLLALTFLFVARGAWASDESFDSAGAKIRYVTAGEGEPLILIHGWMSDATMWGRDGSGNPKLNTASLPGFRVIAFDCRGHGKSDKPHDPKLYGTELAEDVVRLMDHLKLPKAHLLGYSMGAFIAGNVVAKHPDRVLSVIYGGQAPIVEGRTSSGGNEVDVFTKTVDEGKDLGGYIMAVSPSDRPKPSPELASSLAKMMFYGKDVVALAAAARTFGELRVSLKALVAAGVPSLFVYGDQESGGTIENVQFLKGQLPRAEVCVIPKANHMTTLGKPAFGAAITDFLTTHRTTPLVTYLTYRDILFSNGPSLSHAARVALKLVR